MFFFFFDQNEGYCILDFFKHSPKEQFGNKFSQKQVNTFLNDMIYQEKIQMIVSSSKW